MSDLEVTVSEKQLDRVIEILERKRGKPSRSLFEILFVPLLIAAVSAGVTFSYNRQQEAINKIETMEKFVNYFSTDHRPEQRVAALTTMVELGYNDLAADFLVSSLHSDKTLGQSSRAFEIAYSRKLLPRLCYLTSVGGYSSEQSLPTLVPVQAIASTDSGFNQLKELAFDKQTDGDVRRGALLLLARLVKPNDDSDGRSDSNRRSLDKEQLDALRRPLEDLATENGASERLQATIVLTRYMNLDAYQDSEEQFLLKLLDDQRTPAEIRSKILESLFSPERLPSRQAGDEAKKIFDNTHDDPNVRCFVAQTLPTYFESKLEKLITAQDSKERDFSANCFLRFVTPASLVAAYKNAQDSDVKDRLMANMQLSVNVPSTADQNAEILLFEDVIRHDPSTNRRRMAYSNLAMLGLDPTGKTLDPRVENLLLHGLSDPDVSIVQAVVPALARSKDSETIRAVEDRLDRIEDPGAREFLADLLARQGVIYNPAGTTLVFNRGVPITH